MFSEKFENGFTLIEPMIVIAIIGILAAIAIPQYFANVETAKTQTVAGNLKMAVDAVSNAFAASNNKVSTDIYNTLNGQSAHDAATISRAGPQKVSIMVSTTGCTVVPKDSSTPQQLPVSSSPKTGMSRRKRTGE